MLACIEAAQSLPLVLSNERENGGRMSRVFVVRHTRSQANQLWFSGWSRDASMARGMGLTYTYTTQIAIGLTKNS